MTATLIALATLLALGASYDFWKRVNRRFRTVDPGRFYKSGLMPSEMLERRIRKLGLRTIIDLRNHDLEHDGEREVVERAGATYVNLPSEQIPSRENIDRFLSILDNPANLPVLVHCHHGRGRANFFGAIYRIEHLGWSPEKARANVRLFAEFGSFARRKYRGKALLAYVPTWSRGADPGSQAVSVQSV